MVTTIKTNVSDRVGKLREASENWKNRVEEKDAAKFIVATKASNVPAELPFKKSEARATVRIADYQPATEKSATETSKSGSSDEPYSALDFERRTGNVRRVRVNEDKMFDSFFAKHEKQIEGSPVFDFDLDAILTTTRWAYIHIFLGEII